MGRTSLLTEDQEPYLEPQITRVVVMVVLGVMAMVVMVTMVVVQLVAVVVTMLSMLKTKITFEYYRIQVRIVPQIDSVSLLATNTIDLQKIQNPMIV